MADTGQLRSNATIFDIDDPAELQHEIERARGMIRNLERQIVATQARYNEVARAYNLTVANLTELTRINTLLERECEELKSRAGNATPLTLGSQGIDLSDDEISAIRKAMARLHHPDAGGDAERMKIWNTLLDALE